MPNCFEKVDFAYSFRSRLRGLLLCRHIGRGYALAFPGCRSIHTLFMSIPIDVIYCDSMWQVIDVKTVRPWNLPASPPRTRNIIECAEGEAARLGLGPGKTPVFDGDNVRDI